MKLFLHIGTEKTGSSYLQSIAALNRDHLRQQGIWFPSAGKREPAMLSGRISPGNAQPLNDGLASNTYKTVRGLLQKWVKEANDHDCERLLLSNELMLLTLSKPGVPELLGNAASEVGIKQMAYLLLLRDPVELALSLYKHRAKRGTCPELEDWITHEFRYGNSLQKFFQNASQIKPNLTCRSYLATDGYLERLLFRDWLGITESLKLPDGRVNPSLNLSELSLIKSLRNYHPYLPEVLYERLLKLTQEDKASEHRLESYYRSVIARELIKYKETWEMCQAILPKDEHFNLPASIESIDPASKVVTLSSYQVDVLNSLLRDSIRPGFRWQLLRLTTRRRLGRLKNRIITLFDGKK